MSEKGFECGHAARWIALFAALMLFACGCSRDRRDEPVRCLADLVGRTCAVDTSSACQGLAEKLQQGINFHSYSDFGAAVEAVRTRKADACLGDWVLVRSWAARNSESFVQRDRFCGFDYAYAMPKGSPLRERINAELLRLKESGELDRIIAKWCDAPDLTAVPFDVLPKGPGHDGSEGRLRFATCGVYEPGSFTRGDDEIAGFDIDILRRLAWTMNMELEIIRISPDALIPTVVGGRADIAGHMTTVTEERARAVDFSVPYMQGALGLLVRRTDADRRQLETADDLSGCRVAHMSSDFHRRELRELQPDIQFAPYSDYSFAIESLRTRKLEAISLGRVIAAIWMAKFPGELKVAFEYADDVCAFLMPKGSPLRGRIDAELAKMRESGETDEIVAKWRDAALQGKVPSLPAVEVPDGAPSYRLAAAAQIEPWCFVADGRAVGVDIDILTRVGNRLGIRFEPKIYSWGGMVDAVNGKRTDIACGGIYTNGETFPTVDVTSHYARERMCVLVRDESYVRSGGIVKFVRGLGESFERTFVTEDRWRMMARGLGVTLLVTLLSTLLGTTLAFPVWLARTSRRRWLSSVAKAYIAILQGTPVLVLLMVLFYLVFGAVEIDALWVAVIGFGLNLSAYAGEMLRSGVGSVPRGQTEAALALGYSPRRAFFRFVLPQAVRAVLPVYRGEIVGLLKMTSIVGYIAINDLTKASDLIRSRTYESFFPILTTAFVYFAVSWLLALVLERLGRRLDPAHVRDKAVVRSACAAASEN